MELSEFGLQLISFVGGFGFGMVAMGYLAYNSGLKNKEKSRIDIIDDRLTELEGILKK